MLSPEHKKKKENEENTEPKEMMTFDEMNENKAFVCNAEVLSKLMDDAKNYGVQKLIDCFNALF